MLFAASYVGILGIGVVVVVLGDLSAGSVPTWRSLAVIFAMACASLVAQALVSKPLDCTSAKTLAVSYRARFFMCLALSEVVAFSAFVVGVMWGPWWVYYVGAAFTLVGFWKLAPTRRNLQADQDRLSLSGCQLSLTAALRTPSA